MRLSTYIQRTRALGDLKVPAQHIDQVAELIGGGISFADLLRKRNSTLTPLVLLGLWRSARRWAAHQAYLGEVAARRREEKLPPIAPALLKQTVAAHEVAVIERAEAMAPAGRAAEHRRRDAIKEAVALWNACLALARKEGQLKVGVLDEADEAVRVEFADHADTTTLTEMPGHRWLAVRRGEGAGALSLTLELPMEALTNQVRARGAELSAVGAGRDEVALLNDLILPTLEQEAFRLKDSEARLAATRSACAAYHNQLCTPRPAAETVAAVWIPRKGAQLAVAVVRKDGTVLATGKAAPGDNPVGAVEGLLGAHPVEGIVLPTKAENPPVLQALLDGFSAMEITHVRPVAMGEAAKLCEVKKTGTELKAVVLALRAVKPARTWGQLDPTLLGLAEYTESLDTDELRAAMSEIRDLAGAGLEPGDLARPNPGAAAKARPAPKVLNPMLKTVDDLRPGMEVAGVVTNITQFGAFLNIGLSHEGLVHVSELADHFVNDPNEVVRVGQEVNARVLGVDRARRRISLSLRADRAPRPTEEGAPRREPGAAPGPTGGVPLDDIPGQRGQRRHGSFGGKRMGSGGVTGASRTQALADLEALFKKK